MNTRIRRFMTLFGAVVLVAGLMVPFAPSALANHTNWVLEVIPDKSTQTTNTGSKTLTAQLLCPAGATCTAPSPINIINIDFEITSGVNNADGNTPQTPDKSCDIDGTNDVDDPTTTTRNEAYTCSTSYSGTAQGSTLVMAWIDHDKIQTNVEADTTEGRYAGPSDCVNDEGLGAQDPADCPSTSTPEPGTGGPNPGVNCPGSPTASERDCTDVVEIVFVANESQNRVDCDDNGGPNTEVENRTGTNSAAVIYTCTVTDNGGNPRSGVQVNGENESGINDPDSDDSASYDSPDYGCTTESSGSCVVTVSQLEGELGTANICWYTASTTSPAEVRCADEPINENQNATTGADTANDSADKTQINWSDPTTASNLDCNPETASNPAGTPHTITCTVRNQSGGTVPLVQVDVEMTGAGDPDSSDSKLLPDAGCETDNSGSCSFTHTSTSTGTTTYRAWIDADNDDTTTEADNAEVQADNDTDNTDVVTKTWVGSPGTIEITPESDSAEVGQCNPYTLTAKTSGNQPAVGAVIDVEQTHEDAGQPNEPTVEFCVPASGPNASNVDTSKGDLGPNSTATDKENPDQKGTAGGETTQTTDANGQVTIGIKVTGNPSNDGSGLVQLVAFWDPNDNDDPDTGEAKDTASKTWTSPAGAGGRTIDCEPETQTMTTDEDATVTCTVKDATGAAENGIEVTFSEQGPGTFASSSQGTTNAQGQVSVQLTSDEGGDQTVTGTITNSTQNEPDTDECERQAGDPTGSPAGVCADSVTVTWEEIPAPDCSDGEDNDGDGETDFPSDPGCNSADDADETDETCPGYENAGGNQIVGTDEGETIQGTEGDDIICGLGGDDQIFGNGGNDIILGGAGDDVVLGGDGGDEIKGNGGNDTLSGDQGNDEIVGGPGDDTIEGNGGRDILIGSGGNDILKGGGGNDILKGSTGNDTLKGGPGNDRINGGSGKDRCSGGPGKDRITNCEKGAKRRRR